MTVLVTGGGGFLGAWTIRRLLARGMTVRVFDASDQRALVREIISEAAERLDWRIGDIASATDIARAIDGCEAVIHLAGLLTPACQHDPVRGAQVNLIGTLNVFEAAKRVGLPKVIYASSVSVFGRDNGEIPMPSTHYGAFKLACEGCARTYWEYDGLASVGFRPAVVYGPGRETGLTGGISMACRAAVRGEPYTIGFSGATDMVYVDDVAAAIEQALLTTINGAFVFNATGGIGTVADVVAAIRRRIPNAEIGITGVPVPFCATIGTDRMREILPDLPRTSLEAGIEQTIEHYRRAKTHAHA